MEKDSSEAQAEKLDTNGGMNPNESIHSGEGGLRKKHDDVIGGIKTTNMTSRDTVKMANKQAPSYVSVVDVFDDLEASKKKAPGSPPRTLPVPPMHLSRSVGGEQDGEKDTQQQLSSSPTATAAAAAAESLLSSSSGSGGSGRLPPRRPPLSSKEPPVSVSIDKKKPPAPKRQEEEHPPMLIDKNQAPPAKPLGQDMELSYSDDEGQESQVFSSSSLSSDADDGNAEDAKKAPSRPSPIQASSKQASAPAIPAPEKDNLPRPKSIGGHQRVVSWGAGVPPPPKHTDYASSPPLSPLGSANSSLNSYAPRSPKGTIGSLTPPPSQRNMIGLGEVIKTNPLESEAETLIMNVIEHQEAVNRARANTGTSSIMNNVPDSAAALFGLEELDLEEELKPIPGLEMPILSTSPNDSQSHASGEGNKAAATKKKKPGHRRTETMEQKLYGLSKAIADLHPEAPASKAHRHTNSSNKGRPSEIFPGAPLLGEQQGAAGVLAQNANLIYRGRKKSEGEESGTTPADEEDVSSDVSGGIPSKKSAAQNWGTLRRTLMVTNAVKKKTDMPGADISELEVGDETGEDIEGGRPVTDAADHPAEKTPPRKQLSGNWVKSMISKPVKGSKGLASDVRTFTMQRKSAMKTYCRLLLFIIVPATGIAAILFYLADNPPTGVVDLQAVSNDTAELINTEGDSIEPDKASASWWILFVCVRHVILFSLAKLLQVILIDFFCLSTRACINLLGQFITLFIVQSKGWPFLLTTWAVLSFGLLSGTSRHSHHWAYWQARIGLFNEENPSGDIPEDEWYHRVLAIAVSVGLLVSAKRLWLGFYLGRKTFNNYAEDLTKVMKKIVLLGKVGILARRLARDAILSGDVSSHRYVSMHPFGMTRENFNVLLRSAVDDNNKNDNASQEDIPHGASEMSEHSKRSSARSTRSAGFLADTEDQREGLTQEQKKKVRELLGEWEEPEQEFGADGIVSIGAILQFRASLATLESPFMFSIAWGDVSNRERTIISTQKVFRRLNLRTPDSSTVKFDILAKAAVDDDGDLDQDMLKDLIRLLRPNRDGDLSVLDFVKSTDAVYKEAKLLRASVYNSEKIDRAFENMINVVFYALMAIIILSQVGYDPLALFLSLSSIILAFAFMIGSASSKMFEGWLFILLRRPYDIGDRIHVSDINNDTSFGGSPGWIVKDVTLFYTTVVFGATNERATISNGSMASSRVINMNRSPNPLLYVYLKFSVETTYEKIQIFEQALRQFVMSRPREWSNFVGFRATEVRAEQGYIEYVTLLLHRDSWHNIGAVLQSKAEVASFALELSKKMNMRYKSPPLPVNLAIQRSESGGEHDDIQSMKTRSDSNAPATPNSADLHAIAALFDKKDI